MEDKKINYKLSDINWSWIFGVLLLFFGFIGMMASDFLPALILALMGIMILPVVAKVIENKWKYKLTAIKKIIIVVIGFFLFGIASTPSDTAKNKINTQQSISEVKSEQKTETENQTKTEAGTVSNEMPAIEQVDVQKKLYPVVKVVDGDTVQVNIDGKNEVLRLIGINTPETVDPRKPAECFGAEASAKSKEILTGKQVSLEADETQSERDKYNRLLRYVYLEDGTNFNKMMIEDGYAYEYTYDTPYKYQADFKEAQQRAKNDKKGLWAEDACNGELTKATVSSNTVTQPIVVPTPSTPTPTENSGSFSCGGKTKCGQMSNCQEARFYLNNCGVTRLDADKDGIPCETLCN